MLKDLKHNPHPLTPRTPPETNKQKAAENQTHAVDGFWILKRISNTGCISSACQQIFLQDTVSLLSCITAEVPTLVVGQKKIT